MLILTVLFLNSPSFADDCGGGGALPATGSQADVSDMGVRPASMLQQQTGGQLFGESVVTGDFDGDGLGDFAVGSPGEGAGGGGPCGSGSAMSASCRESTR